MKRRSIVFIAWGDRYVADVRRCLAESVLPPCDVLLVTDEDTPVGALPPRTRVLRIPFTLGNKTRKLEGFAALPDDLESVLFLDADVRVVDDVTLGFVRAEQFGMALAPAPHYSLAHTRGFERVMLREGVAPRGQMVYNSGVVFFDAVRADVRAIFARALEVARRESGEYYGDQPFLTLAMELNGFNPYTLSPSFNHRGFGELVSGTVRIWHSTQPMPEDATALAPGFLYRFEGGRFVQALRVPL